MIGREEFLRTREIARIARAARIQELNDDLRIHGRGGYVLVTRGLIGLGCAAVQAAYLAVAAFDRFDHGNDPHGEHDFGAVEVAGETLFWKIDAYDRTRTLASPDPTDPKETVRVMTLMLAEEY